MWEGVCGREEQLDDIVTCGGNLVFLCDRMVIF